MGHMPMMIVSTMLRWWCGSRVAAGVGVRTFEDIRTLPAEESDAIDLVRMDDDGGAAIVQDSGAASAVHVGTADAERTNRMAWRRRGPARGDVP